MKQSLFNKYFRICASIILISITFLGVVLLIFASRYFKADKFELLERNAKQAAAFTQSNYKDNDYRLIVSDSVRPAYNILGAAVDSDIFLTDMSGRALIWSSAPNGEEAFSVPKVVVEQVKAKGVFSEMGGLTGLYKEPRFTVGVPVFNGYTGEMVGVVFSSASASALSLFLLDILKMFALSALAVILLAFVGIYFITSNMVRPLQDMAAATRSFAAGDFSIRVPVEEQDEMGQLAIAFNSMAASLANVESMRRSFVANVSHELKTPMTTIGGFIDGILDGTIPPERQSHYLGVVSDEIKRLSRLVRSMLDISRIEAGEMPVHPEKVDIHDLACRTIFTFEHAIEQKQIEIRGLEGPKALVEADPDLAHQVIYNLVENAVKFTNEGGFIEIAHRSEGGMIYTSIKNTGAGIPENEIPKLFDRFYKSDKSRSLDKNGVGLGLCIVKTIINLHGGEINVNSEQGQYAEFVFSLPAPAKTREVPGIFRMPGKRSPHNEDFTN